MRSHAKNTSALILAASALLWSCNEPPPQDSTAGPSSASRSTDGGAGSTQTGKREQTLALPAGAADYLVAAATGCDAGDLEARVVLRGAYKDGRGGVEVAAHRVLALQGLVCDGRGGDDCLVLGDMYEGRVQGLTADLKAAELLYRRLCEASAEMEACYRLARLYSRAEGGVVESPERIRELYQSACSGGVETSCEQLLPKTPGLFAAAGAEFLRLPHVTEDNFTQVFSIRSSDKWGLSGERFGRSPRIHEPVRLLLVKDDGSPPTVQVQLFATEQVASGWGSNKGEVHHIAKDSRSDCLSVKKVSTLVSEIRVTCGAGRYILRLRHQLGVADWAFGLRILREETEAERASKLARTRRRSGDLTGAIAAYSDAMQLDPSMDNARYQRACIYALLGQPEDAVADLRPLLEANPLKWKKKIRKDKDFNGVRTDPAFVEACQ